MAQDKETRRHPDGAIDTGHYLNRGRQMRAEQAVAIVDAVNRKAGSARPGAVIRLMLRRILPTSHGDAPE